MYPITGWILISVAGIEIILGTQEKSQHLVDDCASAGKPICWYLSRTDFLKVEDLIV